jgi:hypothetical protein
MVDISGLATAINLAAAKTILDHLATTIVIDGEVYKFTAGALALAPSGGGGGTADWTTDERKQIRDVLGVAGDKADAAGGSLAAALAAVKAKTDTIGAANWTFSSPVNSTGEIEIVRNDDYSGTAALVATRTAYTGPSLAGGTAEFSLTPKTDYDAGTTGTATVFTGTLAQDGTTVTATIALTAAQTALLEANPPEDVYGYVYQLVGITAGGLRHTLLLESLNVRRDVA